jgi:hypothetical protein
MVVVGRIVSVGTLGLFGCFDVDAVFSRRQTKYLFQIITIIYKQ